VLEDPVSELDLIGVLEKPRRKGFNSPPTKARTSLIF
jgi:hypothetical protein